MIGVSAERDSEGVSEAVRSFVDRTLPSSLESHLIGAVLDMLIANSDASIGMRELSDVSGIAIGSIYSAVRSKDELLDLTKIALVRALSLDSAGDVDRDALIEHLQLVYGNSGGLPKFLSDRRRPAVGLPETMLDPVVQAAWPAVDDHRAETATQILFSLLANVRIAHPSTVHGLIGERLDDVCRGLALVAKRPPAQPSDDVLRLLRDHPFEPRYSSRWTSGLAEMLQDRAARTVSLSDLARTVGVAVSTAYATTTVDDVLVALHLDLFHAMTRDLDRLDDPALRLQGIHLRLNQAVDEHPWVLGVFFDAQIPPPGNWREPQPRPFESWIELQIRGLDRLGRVRAPFGELLHAYSAFAIAPLGVLVSRHHIAEARAWPGKLATASIRPS